MGERPRADGGEVLRDGARAVFGVLAALRDAVGETVGEIIDPDPTEAGQSAGPAAPDEPAATQRVREQRVAGDLPLFTHGGWSARFPWLVQGITGRGGTPEFDLGLSGDRPVGEALEQWRRLQSALGMEAIAHARQVHGAELLRHRGGEPGLLVSSGYDGHVTDAPALALTVSVADCVPIYLVDPDRRHIALLHGGWRGVAAGVLEAGLAQIARMGSSVRDVWMHVGPAICGDCYEVGPEVHEVLGLPRPEANRPVDLRQVLVERARDAGMREGRISVSEHCTRCGDSPFFSHRGGDAGRQMAYLGLPDR